MSTQPNGGLDAFLGYSSRASGKGGGYLSGWKSNVDDDHGEITIWMHTGMMPRPYWVHPTFRVIADREDKLIVVPRRWTCHEPDAIAKLQKFRNDDGTAEHRPTICPDCILTSAVALLVEQGKLGFTDVVFEWKGDTDTVQILAGGIYGHYRKKKGLTRDQQVLMRKASIKQNEAYKHDMRTQLKYMLAVVDEAHLDNGCVTAVESEGLANKIRAAIVAEGEKVQARTKISMVDERVRDQWDPSRKPYPFLWKYDASKDFDDKFNVIAIPGQEISDEMRALIIDGDLPDLADLEPGNCYELRAELEAHCKVSLPWDEIFEPAEKAGLMKPPAESKEEVGNDSQERTPEINTKQDVPADGAITIGPDHVVWKNKAYKPGQEFKGREVLILPPEKAEDADVSRVIALFKSVATAVGEHVLCEHCNGEMTTFDPSCPKCGAEYSDDGKLVSRPCVNPICGEQVDLEAQRDKADPSNGQYICAKCATVQRIDESGAWVEVKPVQSVQSARRRRASA